MKEKKTNTNEVWKTIEDFPRYQVSNQGRIKSLTNPKNPKFLRPSKTKDGYLMMHLVSGCDRGSGDRYTVRIHQLVAKAFIPNPLNRCYVFHINGNRQDNRVENLKWVTPEEHKSDPITVRNRMAALPQRLEKTSKPVLVYDENLTLLSAFTSTAETARKLNLSQGNITNVCNGTLNHYKHMIFSYIPLNSMEDRKKVEQEAEEKRKRRLRQVVKACQKIYWKDVEKSREKYRLMMRNRYGKKKSEQNSRGDEEA